MDLGSPDETARVSEFLFALVAVVLTSLGSRDQLLVARLSHSLGQHKGLLLVGCAVGCGTAAAMAWGGHYVSALLPDAGKTMLVAFALLMAAAELAWPNKAGIIREPTRSLGAAALVLAFRQMGDASRFVIFALAAALASPVLAGMGGALGAVIAVALGWILAGELERRWPLRMIRITLAIVLLVIGVLTALSARGLLA